MFFELVTGGEGTKVPLDEVLQRSRKTGKLNFSGRSLKAIPPKLWALTTLPVKEGDWWDLKLLEDLNLSDNQIDENGLLPPPNGDQDTISDSIGGVTQLNLDQNKLQKVPEEFLNFLRS